MSNDTGNDQNLFTLKITEDRVAKLWHNVVKLHVQGYTGHHKTNENFSSKISAPVCILKQGRALSQSTRHSSCKIMLKYAVGL